MSRKDVAEGCFRGEGLGKKGPKRHMQSEASLAAVGSRTASAQKRVGDEEAEGLKEIRERVKSGDFSKFFLKP